jgi:hypothetical protein
MPICAFYCSLPQNPGEKSRFPINQPLAKPTAYLVSIPGVLK